MAAANWNYNNLVARKNKLYKKLTQITRMSKCPANAIGTLQMYKEKSMPHPVSVSFDLSKDLTIVQTGLLRDFINSIEESVQLELDGIEETLHNLEQADAA